MDMSEALETAESRTTTWVATPGIHTGVPNEEYHGDKAAVSSSRLKAMLRSPAHFLAASEGNTETKAKAFGSALHSLLLEPHKFDDEFMVVRTFEKRTKAGKSLAELVEQAAGGRALVNEADHAEMQAMVESAHRHGAVRTMLAHGEAETSFVWEDEETGVLLKVRPDWLQRGIIWDVKTAVDGSFDGFSRACATYQYALSAAMYRAGVKVLTGEEHRFRFVVLEKGRPYATAVYEADADFLKRGDRDFRRALRTLAECRKTGEWPAYQTNEIGFIGLPTWA